MRSCSVIRMPSARPLDPPDHDAARVDQVLPGVGAVRASSRMASITAANRLSEASVRTEGCSSSAVTVSVTPGCVRVAGKFQPAEPADFRRRADFSHDLLRDRRGDRQQPGHFRRLHAERAVHGRAIEPAALQVGGEQRALDERQIAALAVLLALGDHQFGVGQRADDRLNGDAQFGGGIAPAVAVGDLVAAFRFRMRPHQDRHLLPGLAKTFDEAAVFGVVGPRQPVGDERRVDQVGRQVHHRRAAFQLPAQVFGRARFVGQPARPPAPSPARRRRARAAAARPPSAPRRPGSAAACTTSRRFMSVASRTAGSVVRTRG